MGPYMQLMTLQAGQAGRWASARKRRQASDEQAVAVISEAAWYKSYETGFSHRATHKLKMGEAALSESLRKQRKASRAHSQWQGWPRYASRSPDTL